MFRWAWFGKGLGRGGIREKEREITSGECRNSVVQMLYMTFGKKKEKTFGHSLTFPPLQTIPVTLTLTLTSRRGSSSFELVAEI